MILLITNGIEKGEVMIELTFKIIQNNHKLGKVAEIYKTEST